MTGETDHDGENLTELILCSREGLYVDHQMIPNLQLDTYINAYVVDFYKHGNIKEIEDENHLRGAWFLLKDIMLCLMTISTCLDLFQKDGENDQRTIPANIYIFQQQIEKKRLEEEWKGYSTESNLNVNEMIKLISYNFENNFRQTLN